jgi:hypothetical protein
MELLWNYSNGQTEELRDKPPPILLCLPQILHRLYFCSILLELMLVAGGINVLMRLSAVLFGAEVQCSEDLTCSLPQEVL